MPITFNHVFSFSASDQQSIVNMKNETTLIDLPYWWADYHYSIDQYDFHEAAGLCETYFTSTIIECVIN